MSAAVPWAVRTGSLMTGRNAVESLRAPFRCQCPDLDHTQGRFSDAAKVQSRDATGCHGWSKEWYLNREPRRPATQTLL